MIMNLEQNPSQNDIEVSIRYPVMDRTVKRIVSFLRAVDTQIECGLNDGVRTINIFDICHIESLDKVAVIHCEKEKLKTGLRLYQLNEKLKGKGFVQISKHCILNINKLDRIKPLFNSRMEAILTNGTRLYVTRRYLADIKRILQDEE